MADDSPADPVAGDPDGRAESASATTGSATADPGAYPEPDAAPAGRFRLGARARTGLLLAMVGVLVVGLVLGGLLVVKVRASGQDEEQRLRALDTARQFTVNFGTLDYRHLDKYVKAVMSLSAGEFRQQYSKGQALTKSTVKMSKTIATPDIREAALTNFGADSANAIVAFDTNQRFGSSKKSTLKSYRLELGLNRVDGAWRVVRLRYVG